ncbi:alcohol dehydrogenase [Paramuricea clavata]|uniref:Alcohol dehydrogenase n=1 Tax=Paramuricea clavata TaxID=317549 RepID=A0A6S7HF71_PARCT|nr:alcohol dehydrogenase [Paramuricea clavata]
MLLKRLLFNLSNSAKILPAFSANRMLSVRVDNATSTGAQRVVFHGPKKLLQTEIAGIPEIGEGEILGKIRAATICGSDLHTIIGRRQEPVPSILGHEGVVEVIGHKCPHSDLNVGDRLTFTVADFCHTCERCESDLPQKCFSLFKYGHADMDSGTGWNGCYATHLVIRKGTHIVKLPDNVPDQIGATLNCALASMTNAVEPLMNLGNLAEKREENKNKTVLVQGAGLLGVYSCALFKEAGYGKIYCYDVHPERLKIAEKFGAVSLNGDKNEEQILKDNSVDTVMEVSGVKKVFPEGMRVIKPGGFYTFVGLVHPNSQLDVTAEQIIRKCLTFRGIHNYGPRHLEQAVEFLSNTVDKYPYDELVSPSFDLDQMNEAVELALSKKYLRVCVEPGGGKVNH